MADPAHEAADAQIAAFRQEVAETYLEAQYEAQQAFQGFMKRFDRRDGEMRAAVERGEVEREDWIAWRKGKMATGKRLSSVLDQMARAYTDANERAMAMLSGRLPQVYAENYNYGTYQAESGAHVSTAFDLMDADAASRLFTAPDSYLPRPSVDKGKDRAWNRRLLKSQITQGVLLGEPVPKMARRVRRVTGSNMAAATRTARTATTAAENAGRTDSYKRARSMGIDMKQEWLATLDGRTRHSHRQMDGERVEVGEGFSNGCAYPGDPTAAYSETMNCRCTLVAAVEGIDRDGADRWSRLPEGMTYEQWKGERAAAKATRTVGKGMHEDRTLYAGLNTGSKKAKRGISVEIDEMTPCLRRLKDGKILQTEFNEVKPKKGDYKDWEFDWTKPAKEGYTVKALKVEGDERVQGLLAFMDQKSNSCVNVGWVESAPHNNAHNTKVAGKEYNGVGAHLFAEAVKESYEKGYNGFIYFDAKSDLTDYYVRELGATRIGISQRMYIDDAAARKLYEKYYGRK